MSPMIRKDPIVELVKRKFDKRSRAGIRKYGTTLESNNTDNFLIHLQEELMDGVNYIEKLLHDKNKKHEYTIKHSKRIK